MEIDIHVQRCWDEHEEGSEELVKFEGPGGFEGVEIGEEEDGDGSDDDSVFPVEPEVRFEANGGVDILGDDDEENRGCEEDEPYPHPAEGYCRHRVLLL